MSDEKRIVKVCPGCGGDGLTVKNQALRDPGDQDVFEEEPCAKCGATGFLPFGELNDDLITMLTDMQETLADIKEKVDEL